MHEGSITRNMYKITENKFGSYKTIILSNELSGIKTEVAFTGATILNYFIPQKNNLYNIIDGFLSPEEFESARGARSWIMAPFANRIKGGKYKFNGKEYFVKPVPPKTQVIHGFSSFYEYKIIEANEGKESAEILMMSDKIRPGVFEGYPFALNVYVRYKLSRNNLSVEVSGENIGDEPLPFFTGWHPYFKTPEEGIENLVVTIDADKVILLDKEYIPIEGTSAYGRLKDFPKLDFRSNLSEEKRKVNGRVLDDCYTGLKKDEDGFSASSIYDPDNGLKISVWQKGGVMLAFSGDSLSVRKRKSIALEPMMHITNAFNRPELESDIMIMPGDKSVFIFGVEYTQL